MKRKIKSSIRANYLNWYIAAVIAAKTMAAGGLFIYALGTARHDDALMTDMARNILEGNWLGAYDNLRLVKGITFPLFLVFNHLTGIPYTILITLLSGLACAAFIRTIGSIIKNKILLGIVFTILYFIPVHVSVHTFLRIYRNVLVPILVMVVTACFIKMYFMRQEKNFLFWAVCSGLALAAFWNLREDSVWLLPFTVTAAVITSLRTALENKASRSKCLHFNIAYALLPFLVLWLANTGIKAVNRYCYGSFVRNELSEGAFPQLMKAINSIEPEEDIDYVSIPKSMVEQLYKISPSFCTLKGALDANFGAGWDSTDKETDGQIKNGWFLWCLRECIAVSGYDTPEKADEFCRKAAAEIAAALEDGRLQKRSGVLMPSALMAPWKTSYAETLPKAIADAFWYTASHSGCTLYPVESIGNADSIAVFETLTHNQAVSPLSNVLEIGGWIVSENDEDSVAMAVCQGENIIRVLPRSGGQDVYEHYAAEGKYLENAKNSRFHIVFTVNEKDVLQFAVLKNDRIIDYVPFSTKQKGSSYYGDGYVWHLDTAEFSRQGDSFFKDTAAARISIFEKINVLYREGGKYFTIAGLVSYFVISVWLFYSAVRKKRLLFLDEWLITSGLLGSVLLLCAGVAYTHISAYNAIHPLYLAGGYPLLTAFSVLSICFLGQEIRKYFSSLSIRMESCRNRKRK